MAELIATAISVVLGIIAILAMLIIAKESDNNGT
jgi:hypothetical protein